MLSSLPEQADGILDSKEISQFRTTTAKFGMSGPKTFAGVPKQLLAQAWTEYREQPHNCRFEAVLD
ncbi:hypothetical protein IP69_18400 [Bosea sp. AAP35]|nr:hypothetical protein IP69_18400 [Bosea sp. AAP35]